MLPENMSKNDSMRDRPHMAQLTLLPLTLCRFSKIQIAFTCLVPAHPGSPG